MINQLIDVISREATLFESFLQLLEQQKEALVKNDVSELNRATQLQHEKLVESQRLNEERQELIAKISEANKIEGDLTVARLLEFVDKEQADNLSKLRDEILEFNDRIAEVRNSNAMLLNQSRESISRTMKTLAHIGRPEPSYDSAGLQNSGASSVVVDRRA